MARFTIKDLAEGRCAVKNDGTVEELNKVLKAAFGDTIPLAVGDCPFYCKYNSLSGLWKAINDGWTEMSTQSVKDFLEELEKLELPKRGDRILVSQGDNNWYDRIFLTSVDGALYPIICVNGSGEECFTSGNSFSITTWRYWKPLPKKETLEVTLEDVAKKFGVDEVKIVEKK